MSRRCKFVRSGRQCRNQDWMAQAPDWQAGVALLTEQTMPQPPQFLVSVWVFTQAPLHSTCPLGQGIVQTPRLQLVPCLQTEPHAPQLEGSEVKVVQNPLQDVPEQALVSPAACILYSTSRLAPAPV
jgi:hypothetical protein